MIILLSLLLSVYPVALVFMLCLDRLHDKTARYHLYGWQYLVYIAVYYLVMPFKVAIDDIKHFYKDQTNETNSE